MENIGKFGCLDRRCHKNIKAMAASGQDVLGIYVGIPTPYIAELAALAGFDYIMMDMEHNIYNPETICDMVRAADACGIAVAARIAQTSLMLPALDFGIVGMKVPHVHNAEQVKELVRISKFSPVGRRGYSGGARAQRYSRMSIHDFKKEADDEVFLMVMIEDKEGIENMEEILAVPGLDYVAIGPGDVSQALNRFGEIHHPDVLSVIDKVHKTADKYGVKYPGGGAPLIIADDRGLVLEAMSEKVREFRKRV